MEMGFYPYIPKKPLICRKNFRNGIESGAGQLKEPGGGQA